MTSHGSFIAAFHILFLLIPPVSAALWWHHRRNIGARYRPILLKHLVFVGVGVQGFMAGLKQIFTGESIAAYLDWAYSPFVAELGLMNLSFGILGLIAPFASRGFLIATSLGYGIFLIGAATGHLYDVINTGNLALGNIGPTLWSDILIPLVLLWLILATRENAKAA
ncbi:DUF6790 family protein [Thioalkalivibrio paradoxus]|uniref:DoxX family protein n=1 Tax=Thioalkalivibrio paradoxus ARh 1 TaxID=713585 RepID=W0DI50_9GAMM|nr:DUF6790 family protein [Thioalkalivibrio paradoxus]AHE98299.1 hypothetical protein THITH_08555 [Thioalkalivibrio paradoxus ARh 1]